MMSIAEQLRQEGKLEGLHEGELKSKLKIAKRMLAENSAPVFIAKVTGLSLKEIEALKPEP
jgi:predicted transposase/invertase (TIGR01784 family)